MMAPAPRACAFLPTLRMLAIIKHGLTLRPSSLVRKRRVLIALCLERYFFGARGV